MQLELPNIARVSSLVGAPILSMLVCIFVAAGCTTAPRVQATPSEQVSTAKPDASPSANATSTLTETPGFVDIRDSLPPGAHVAYWQGDTWHLQGLDGSDALDLMPGITGPLRPELQLSPDGNLVAFSSGPGELSTYDFRTGQLTSFPNADVSGIFSIQWAPDGNTLYYLGTPDEFPIYDGNMSLFAVTLATHSLSTMIGWRDAHFPYGIKSLRISNDGQWLAFEAPRNSEIGSEDPEYAIYLVDPACLEGQGICPRSVQLVGTGENPTWSMDGKLGWVCSENGGSALCVFDSYDPTVAPRVFLTAGDLKPGANARLLDFTWSPDGITLAVTVRSDGPSNPQQIPIERFLVSESGAAPINLSEGSDKDEWWEGWSRDGRYLAFVRAGSENTEPYGELGLRSRITTIHVYDVQTGEQFDLADSPGLRQVFDFFLSRH